ncbi:type VI secretion system-associated protein VasI [Modicisalibacter xianhensis]|uniref:Type VI secretion system protein VasI n=1 Tax=Modicisalibacter xianhensis TaxID=442341 RepID=A0A1I3FDK6_9GAMM|nr:type VI secretion system-associated protein VasI [Halomonas xianhensis]SFI08981.1 type VI secretion system protein VasI [Halomonas xianhensis]
MMHRLGLSGVLGATLLLLAPPALAQEKDRLDAALGCAETSSRLARLHCYDALFRGNDTINQTHDPRPAQWYRVQAMERHRQEDDFSVRSEVQDNGDVLMSAPALGTVVPRPRLVISCEDTITRFQLHLEAPLTEGRTRLRLDTGNASLEQEWRIRDGGYVVSGGRGLPAIDTLRRLLDAGTLTLGSDIASLDGLRFELQALRTRIAPLRTACHW